MRTRWLLLLAIVVIVVGVGIAINRGATPLAQPEGCTATVANHEVGLETDQAENASLIAAIGVRRGLPARAVSIALAAAYQESKLINLSHGDRDSLGLFQQRPSQGWGTAAQIQDPVYATNAFYDALVKVDGYEHMQITVAAQKVQRSGYPEAYQDHAADARALASALTGFSAGGRFSCVVHASSVHGTITRVESTLTTGYGAQQLSVTGTRTLRVGVPATAAGSRLGWSMAQYLTAHAKTLRITRIDYAGKVWRTAKPSEKGWTKGTGPATRITVTVR